MCYLIARRTDAMGCVAFRTEAGKKMAKFAKKLQEVVGLGSRSGNPRQLYCRDESDPRWRQLKEKIKSLKPKE